jgi:hypothetical protein
MRRSAVAPRCRIPPGHQLLGGLGLALQPGQPGSWNMRGTCLPAARRWRITAMSWRVAAAFCSRVNEELWASSSPGRASNGAASTGGSL